MIGGVARLATIAEEQVIPHIAVHDRMPGSEPKRIVAKRIRQAGSSQAGLSMVAAAN